MRWIISRARRAWPLAVSTTSTSTPASRRAPARSMESPKKPTPAPTSRRPWPSLEASGNCSDFTKSFTVIRPVSFPSAETSGRRSRLFLRNIAVACSGVTSSGAVNSSVVITSATRVVAHSATGMKRRSRLVQMPSRRFCSSTTGRPETRNWPHRESKSSRVASGPMVTGLVMRPVWVRLTRSTWWAWSSMERLRCRMPMPPWRAMAIAIRDSVTVSMAALASGTFKEISLVRRVPVSTSEGITSVSPGSSSTSS